MPDYNKLAANALKMIAKAGKEYDISRPNSAVDEITGIPTDSAPTTGKLVAIILPHRKAPVFAIMDNRFLEGTLTGRFRFVLAAAKDAPFLPQPMDILTIDGDAWEVVGCSPLSPAGIPLLYTIAVNQT